LPDFDVNEDFSSFVKRDNVKEIKYRTNKIFEENINIWLNK
jgi:hypothetical protein